MSFYIAQFFGIVALIITVSSVHFKTKEQIVFLSILANIAVALQYLLLGADAFTGFIISILNTIRCVVFYLFKRKDKKPNIYVLLLFEVVAVASGIYSWKNMWSIIPVVVTMIYTYGLWQDNVKVIRICTCLTASGWTLYNIVVKAYTGAIQSFSEFTSSAIAIWRNKRNSNI